MYAVGHPHRVIQWPQPLRGPFAEVAAGRAPGRTCRKTLATARSALSVDVVLFCATHAGESTRSFDFEDAVQDVFALLDALPAGRMVLVGLSLGGILAQEVVRRPRVGGGEALGVGDPRLQLGDLRPSHDEDRPIVSGGPVRVFGEASVGEVSIGELVGNVTRDLSNPRAGGQG